MPTDAGQSLQSFGGNEQAWKQYKQATQETQSLHTGEKNAMQQLNELYSQIQYVCDEPTGPLLNARLFRVSVRVEGQNYEGMANNKRTAKLAAANAAMEGLRVSGLLQARQAELEGNRQMRQEKQRDVIKRLKENGKFFPNRQREERVVEYEYTGPANPCTRLGDFHADPQYKIVGQLGEHPDIVFTVQCIVKGISYMGCGRTKRDGKYNAAEKALRSLGLWTREDEELKLYRETHDGKNPTTQQRKTFVRRHKDTSAGEFQPTDKADKAFGFKKGGNQTSRWGGPKRGGGGGGGGGRGGGGNQRAGAANAGFNRVGSSKDGFKSVLSSQWTQFKKGGTLGSGLVFEDGSSGGGTGRGTNQGNKGGAKKITGGTQSMAQQPPAQQEDFTVDSYGFDNQPASSLNSQSYGYGYGNQSTGQQQQEAYFTTGNYAESYQNPAYGYGYDQYSSTGMNQYAQQY